MEKTQTGAPHLARALGTGDLTWLYLVAVVNLNMVPVVAAEGLRAVWLWVAAILFFFLPQAITVMELAERSPGEGGLYLWTKETFGDFAGFLCGWCYWLTNMFFVPSLLFYVTGVAAYLGAAGLVENRVFFFAATNLLLWVTIAANVRGLGVGKWVNNIGGVGALTIAAALMALAFTAREITAGPALWSSLAITSTGALPFSALGVVCLALVGLEIGPVMGDEVRDPRRTFPRAILLGGVLCATVYVGSTLSLTLAIPQSQMAVVQGLMQAIDKLSMGAGLGWIVPPLAILLVLSIAGSTSAWVSGSARILFVCGLDRYLPKALGRMHPRYGSPCTALYMFGALASGIIAMSFAGASVKEAYLTLLDIAVALQMISYMCMFGVLARRAFSRKFRKVYFNRMVLCPAAVTGLAMTIFAFGTAFVPSRQITSIWSFETKMVLSLGTLIAAGCGFFFYYRQRRV